MKTGNKSVYHRIMAQKPSNCRLIGSEDSKIIFHLLDIQQGVTNELADYSHILEKKVQERTLELQQTNERLQVINDEKTRYLMHATHQLKAPFAAIQSYTDLILEGYVGETPKETRDVVQKIKIRCDQLSRTIKEMLELSNLKSQIKERNTTKRQEYKQRLSEIRDKKKSAILERIDNKITTLNKKHTDRFNKLLEKLTSILSRIEAKADDIETDGVNVSTVDVAVQNAKDAIAIAQREITEQSEKENVIEIDEENNLGSVVSSALNEFRKDMAIIRDSVKVVRDAVFEAAKTLREVIKSSNLDNGTEK